MTKGKLRLLVTIVFLTGQTLSLLMLAILSVKGGFDAPETKIALAAVLPLFAAHLTLSIRSLLTQTLPKEEPSLSVGVVSLILALSAIPSLAVLALVFGKGLYNTPDFEGLMTWLGVVQTAYAALCGLVVESLFRGRKTG
jgi:hypothetical protein